MTLSVLAAAREVPDSPALVIGGRRITFGELAQSVLRRAAWLRSRVAESGEGRPVGLVGASDPATLETVYALMAAGTTMFLIHPRLTPKERDAAVAMVRPGLVLASAAGEVEPTADDMERLEQPVDAAQALAILMTSGTTGVPKGVVLSRRAFLESARKSARNIPLREGDRWLLGLPIAHVGGLSVLTRCLVARCTAVVPAEVATGRRLDADALARTIDEDRVTLVSLVPTQLEWLLSRSPAWRAPPQLRAILLGGAAARPSLLERAADRGVPVLTTYGLTEACSQVTTQLAGTVNRGELGCGPPMEGTEVRIVDGTIEIRGPTLFDGYLPVSSEPVFAPGGWLATNDVGRLDARGNLHVLGRRSDLVITGGENVHPLEVEAVMDECPGVAASCAFGVRDDTWGEILAIAVVASPPGPPADAMLSAFAAERLSPHRRPRLVAHIDELPTTPAGKLDRKTTRKLAAPHLRRLEPPEIPGPRGPVRS